MNFSFTPGDRVELNEFPGRIGVVLMVDGEGENGDVWLDCYPGAVGNYHWVYARFPHSWCPDKLTIHAVNIIKASDLTLIKK